MGADYFTSPTRRVRGFALTALLVLLCVVDGCRKSTDQKLTQVRTGTSDAVKAIDKGDLKLEYQKRKGFRRNASENEVGSNQQAMAQIIARLNNRIALPWDIVVRMTDCDDPDAYYDKGTHSLVICYQLVDQYYRLFAPRIKNEQELDDAVRGAVASTFFHELGHALIDAWKLPVTGKEEDAADQLSTLILINDSDRGEQMALDGAVSFKLYAEMDKRRPKIYWDEHSLDEQRFYDTICLIYGHDPVKYDYLVQNGILPMERAATCEDQYTAVARAWRLLLSPYIKQRPQPASN